MQQRTSRARRWRAAQVVARAQAVQVCLAQMAVAARPTINAQKAQRGMYVPASQLLLVLSRADASTVASQAMECGLEVV
jgi:hypothetical protein